MTGLSLGLLFVGCTDVAGETGGGGAGGTASSPGAIGAGGQGTVGGASNAGEHLSNEEDAPPEDVDARHVVEVLIRNSSTTSIYFAPNGGTQCTALGVSDWRDGEWTPRPIDVGYRTLSCNTACDASSPGAYRVEELKAGETATVSWDGRVTTVTPVELTCGDQAQEVRYASLAPLDANRAQLTIPYWVSEDLCDTGEFPRTCLEGSLSGCVLEERMCTAPQTASVELAWPEDGNVNAEIIIQVP